MQRRQIMQAGGVLALGGVLTPAFAHHGWSSFDQGRPIYLEGQAVSVAWRNPHAELVLEVPQGLSLPSDLVGRALPAQTAAVDGPALLAKAVVPTRRDRRWEVELAPMFRLGLWQVPEIRVGQALSMVGFTFIGETGDPVLRVEYLFLDGKAYGLRSSPA
jgi:hypothetical protein